MMMMLGAGRRELRVQTAGLTLGHTYAPAADIHLHAPLGTIQVHAQYTICNNLAGPYLY